MRRILLVTVILAGLALAGPAPAQALRPPSVPLIACDPYFSVWSPADKLTDTATTHWTGKAQPMTGLVDIDGAKYRFMGRAPANVPALAQTQLKVLPTRTIYTFEGAGVRFTVTFMTPDLPDDLDILSRPLTYVTMESRALDGHAHKVSAYFDVAGVLACNTPEQAVNFEPADAREIKAWRVGTVAQRVLQTSGDDVRIDWGYCYLAMADKLNAGVTAGPADTMRAKFLDDGALAAPAPEATLKNAQPNNTVLACVVKMDASAAHASSGWLMLAYDDLYSIQYMGKNLRPYWRRKGWDAGDLLRAAAHDYAALQVRCAAFDDELMRDLRAAGGEGYAELCALAFRQCFAAGKFVADENGQPLQFCKENHSNGCISTSDVFYPMSPQFLLFGPTLAKSFMAPFMNYTASVRWKFPFAPHDLGTYPKANGQVYGDGERGENNQMPVEETGNLLCLFGAVADMEGNADFAGLYWPQLEQWARYLKEKGFDPEKQLCTDDFAGHLAHNVNLSVKAICGLGSFAKLCQMRGDEATATAYYQLARGFAQRWMKEADDGDHYRLAFDKPGTWSQKYNLVWDKVLGLNLFPAEVARKEMDFYLKRQNEYGLPLDNRETYTKLDWITWTATLTQNRADFMALVAPVVRFVNQTPDRAPLTDWYQTKSAKKVGFTARPVIGGVFMRMLYEKPVWQKYARREKTKAAGWAPIPPVTKMTVILPAADTKAAIWNYTTSEPAQNWMRPDFDDAAWKRGPSGFGAPGTPGAVVGTTWKSGDIWLRRSVALGSTAAEYDELEGWFHHDEGAEVYINGVLAIKSEGFATGYDAIELTPEARAAVKQGNNLIAIHCHQTVGGQYVDFGLVDVQKP
ncbi:MAG TPA: DUF4965 domain-containing protein [Verrucomicrobiae bacterium]|jgi:hypothetical protein|nr:DUF4965 domain-containing protein [Verrucomicrobiae bacterium]